MKKTIQVVPDDKSGWKIVKEGNKRATRVTVTKREAVQLARELSKENKYNLIVHRKDGTVRVKDRTKAIVTLKAGGDTATPSAPGDFRLLGVLSPMLTGPQYECPIAECDRTWIRHEVGQKIPLCPVHRVKFVRVKNAS